MEAASGPGRRRLDPGPVLDALRPVVREEAKDVLADTAEVEAKARDGRLGSYPNRSESMKASCPGESI